jgi:ribulose-5-phosphate 4-epimerase/fuculose-1-phosphate aldolase
MSKVGKKQGKVEKDLRERVAAACRVLARLDLTSGGQGHVSARIPGTDRVLIRARGPNELGVRYTTPTQVMEVDLNGKLVHAQEEGLAVPIEVFIHTAVYRARPEIGSVIHIHPPTVVLFTICDKPLLPLYGSYDPPSLQLILDGIPTYDRSILIRTPELGAELVKTMGDAPVCMMRGHGITSAAGTIEEAALGAIRLNDLAKMNQDAYLLGNPRPISLEDQAEFRDLERRNTTPGPARARAAWRYYRALTES